MTLTPEFMLLFAIIMGGYLVGAATGFGSAIISLTFSVLLLPITFMVPVIVPLNLVICIYLVGRHWDGVDLRILLTRILPLSILGMPIGLWLFAHADAGGMKPYFGLFVFLLAAFELLRMKFGMNKPNTTVKSMLSHVWLFAGGIVQGLWVSGGPLIAYWAGKHIDSKKTFRSTLSAVWLILNIILFIGHLLAGRINEETSLISLKLLPAVLIGILLGEWLHKSLPEKGFRVVVFLVLLFAGGAIVIHG